MLQPDIRNQIRRLLDIFLVGDKSAGEALSDGQVDIAAAIMLKLSPRNACVGPTGYGKSESIAMGAIYRVVFFKEDFVICSVKYGTSEIIMEKVIEHLFDNELLLSQLELEKGQELQRLKRERRKDKLTFRRGGSVKVVSLHGADDDVSKAIGEHAPNIILDESPLLSPAKYLQVLKILEGTGSFDKTFLFELGNAVNRNHFMYNVKSNPKYLKIDISLEQAIAEGRLDQTSVDEKRGLPFFEQFYECKFPDEDEIDEKGYRQLVKTEEIDARIVDSLETTQEPMKLGVDVAGGGDYNTFTIRQGHQAWIETFNRSNDTMTNVNEVIRIIDKYTITVEGKPVRLIVPEEVYIDDIGIGRGVTDRLKELGYKVNGISVGEKPQEADRYANKKADYYWRVRLWIQDKANKLLKDKEGRWHQLAWIKYKTSTDKVLQIEPKDDLKKRTGKSPDWAESFMLTFADAEPQPGIRLL
jgi:hypothetical protein